MEIRIKCPTCGKILRLQDEQNINVKTFTCPVCKERHVIGNCKRIVEQPKPQAPVGEETQYGGLGANNQDVEETRIELTPETKAGGLVDNFGRKYQLQMGINTIGRKANSSTATVQIDTQDRTMSRSHAIVDVRNAGGQIVHILKNGANKNPSYLNGSVLGPNDQMVLNNGNRIKFGDTELIFKKTI